MTIEFIYFDLGKVLLDFTHERGFAQIASVAGITEGRVQSALFDDGLSDRYDTGELSTREFHKCFCDATGSSVDENELATAWSDIFEIKADTIALAANLKAGGHQLGILSNTCPAHWEFAKKKFRVLDQLFDPVITSYDARSMKPDAAIYHMAAERSGCSPEHLFFVDDRQENVDGALKCGWHARLFTNAMQLANDLEQLHLDFNR